LSQRLKTVNFGSGNAGLSTVGYTMYNKVGSTYKARATSGVFEVGTSTGVYGCLVDFPKDDEVILLWDTGAATPRYAMDESTVQINSIQEETDKIRVIWNTLKNNGELYTKLITKINGVKVIDNKKDLDDLIKEIKKISIPKVPTIAEIKEALNVTVNSPSVPVPIVNIPDISIPDYTKQISRINDLLINISISLNRIPKDSLSQFNSLSTIISKIKTISELSYSKMDDDTKEKRLLNSLLVEMNKLSQQLKEAQRLLNESIVENTKLDKVVKDLVTANGITKLFDSSIESKRQQEQLRIGLGLR